MYEWEQSLEEVNLYIETPPGVTADRLDCKITPRHIRLGIKGNPPFIDVSRASLRMEWRLKRVGGFSSRPFTCCEELIHHNYRVRNMQLMVTTYLPWYDMTEPRCACAPSGYAWQEDTGGPVVVEESYWMMGKRGGVVGSFSDQVSDHRFRAALTTSDSSTNTVTLPAGGCSSTFSGVPFRL